MVPTATQGEFVMEEKPPETAAQKNVARAIDAMEKADLWLIRLLLARLVAAHLLAADDVGAAFKEFGRGLQEEIGRAYDLTAGTSTDPAFETELHRWRCAAVDNFGEAVHAILGSPQVPDNDA
jgi:phage-related tail protein